MHESPWRYRRNAAPALAMALVCMGLAILAMMLAMVVIADAAPSTGRVRGRLFDSQNNAALSYADVVLLPADTTQKRVGGMSNADGTFLLEAPAGTYTLQVRAISYRQKSITGVVVEAGGLRELPIAIEPEAIQQEGVEVIAEARRNSEAAMLMQRKRAATVGDAVSAEQVRKSPDSDAGEVLRRVTGMSVFQNKFVFVRGMGERYSSTEVDGVRISSPEQNKRVVPLDLIPASLLENVVVQKTYSADRPGEFGGGDVQVHTRDFPGKRTFSLSAGQGYDAGTTFHGFSTYTGGRYDGIGYGADTRKLPDLVSRLAGRHPIFPRGNFDPPGKNFSSDTLAAMGRSFRNVWSPYAYRAPLGGSYSQNYGDEFKVFGRALGVVQSATFNRSLNTVEERERLYQGTAAGDQVYDYRVARSTETVQMSGMAAASYRLAPNHSIHLRSLYTRNSENEARSFEGYNSSVNRNVRSSRLLYVERTILSNGIEGKHEMRGWIRPRFEWKASRTRATRVEPDRRETIYQENVNEDDPENVVRTWTLYGGGLGATRYFGDLSDKGFGYEGKASFPITQWLASGGKIDVGASRHEKDRESFYRRFLFVPAAGSDVSAPPESLFQANHWKPGYGGAELKDVTRPQDNYTASQNLSAGFVNFDLPLTKRLRAVAGLRVERAEQDVRTYDYTAETPALVASARLHDTDLLPAANLILSLDDRTNVRVSASRTLSRPDLRELTPATTLEFLNGLLVAGNPNLRRARIDNYDLRVERFRSANEVVAIGGFYKNFHDPIELVISADGSNPFLRPENSEGGHVAGGEFELRTGLGSLWEPLAGVFFNSNFSLIRSRVKLHPRTTELGTREHPLQGQSDILLNGGLGYSPVGGAFEVSILSNTVGKRLAALGIDPRPDRYEQARTTFDGALGWTGRYGVRLKLAARNLTDTEVRVMDGDKEARSYRPGRGYSLTATWSL